MVRLITHKLIWDHYFLLIIEENQLKKIHVTIFLNLQLERNNYSLHILCVREAAYNSTASYLVFLADETSCLSLLHPLRMSDRLPSSCYHYHSPSLSLSLSFTLTIFLILTISHTHHISHRHHLSLSSHSSSLKQSMISHTHHLCLSRTHHLSYYYTHHLYLSLSHTFTVSDSLAFTLTILYSP